MNGDEANNRVSWKALAGRLFLAVAGLVWLFAAAVTYSQEGTAEGQEEGLMQGKAIQEVLKEHTAGLMALPGVVGTAQGECEGKPCIKVFVVKKSADLLKQIPTVIEGYAVEVQETGEIRAADPS